MTTCRVNIIESKDFAELAINKNADCFAIHVSQVMSANEPSMHQDRQDHIARTNVARTVNLPSEYVEYFDIFSDSDAVELSSYESANHIIDLIDEKQPSYGFIYSLNEVELNTLRDYIEINLTNDFIRSSTSSTESPILFVKKSNEDLRLCVNYRELNMITIKNRYPLSLVNESIDRLTIIKRYTQLNLIAIYYRLRIKKGDE